MSTPTDTPPTPGRRARRAAQRRSAPAAGRGSAPSSGRSPILWMTVVIGGLGVVALAAFVLLQGGPATADTANLLTPGVPTPLALADGRAIGKADAPVTLRSGPTSSARSAASSPGSSSHSSSPAM